MQRRLRVAKKFGFNNIKFIKGDLSVVKFTEKLFKKYDFDIIIERFEMFKMCSKITQQRCSTLMAVSSKSTH